MKKLLEKISLFLSSLIGNLFELFRKHAELAVNITGMLKLVVESPVAGVVADIIPGDLDNKILLRLQKIIPVVAEKMALTYGILKQNDDNSDAFGAIIGHLKSINEDARASFWIIFSGELNIALSDGQLTLSEAVSLAQLVYSEKTK